MTLQNICSSGNSTESTLLLWYCSKYATLYSTRYWMHVHIVKYLAWAFVVLYHASTILQRHSGIIGQYQRAKTHGLGSILYPISNILNYKTKSRELRMNALLFNVCPFSGKQRFTLTKSLCPNICIYSTTVTYYINMQYASTINERCLITGW